jgi:ribosomal protein S8
MNRVVPYFALAASLLLGGCITTPPKPPRSQLEVRQSQTREYQTSDSKLVMKAVLNALQDDGFIAKNAVVELGLITATREIETETTANRIFSSILMGNNARWEKAAVIEATINVSEFGKETRVRVSFQKKILDNFGLVLSVSDVDDPLYYQSFFTKIDKSLYIQKERI